MLLEANNDGAWQEAAAAWHWHDAYAQCGKVGEKARRKVLRRSTAALLGATASGEDWHFGRRSWFEILGEWTAASQLGMAGMVVLYVATRLSRRDACLCKAMPGTRQG